MAGRVGGAARAVRVTERDPEYLFNFPDPGAGAISPPIIGFSDVDFNYQGGPTLFRRGPGTGGSRGRRRPSGLGGAAHYTAPETSAGRRPQEAWGFG